MNNNEQIAKRIEESRKYPFSSFLFDHFRSVAFESFPSEKSEDFVEHPYTEKSGELRREIRECINDYCFVLASANPRVFSMLMDSYTIYLYTEINGNSLLG